VSHRVSQAWHARKNHAFCAPRGLAEGFISAQSAAGDFAPIKSGSVDGLARVMRCLKRLCLEREQLP
jgi:hypothetical protein